MNCFRVIVGITTSRCGDFAGFRLVRGADFQRDRLQSQVFEIAVTRARARTLACRHLANQRVNTLNANSDGGSFGSPACVLDGENLRSFASPACCSIVTRLEIIRNCIRPLGRCIVTCRDAVPIEVLQRKIGPNGL
jgi:hypothetical protein